MAERDWGDLFTDSLAKLGPPRAGRILRVGGRVIHALTGRQPQMRVRFRDLTMFGGQFEGNADAVRHRIPDVFDLVEHEPGRTAITVLALDYRSIDVLSPYGELAISVPVRYAGERGELVLEMPVTTEEARWGGVTAYGFPKSLADIRFSMDDGTRVCRLNAGGMHVLVLRVPLVPEGVPTTVRVRNFNVRADERVIGSTFDADGEIGRSDVAGGATIELGEHPIGAKLRALGISSISMSHVDGPHLHAVLSKGEELGIAGRPAPAAPPRRRPRWIAAPARGT